MLGLVRGLGDDGDDRVAAFGRLATAVGIVSELALWVVLLRLLRVRWRHLSHSWWRTLSTLLALLMLLILLLLDVLRRHLPNALWWSVAWLRAHLHEALRRNSVRIERLSLGLTLWKVSIVGLEGALLVSHRSLLLIWRHLARMNLPARGHLLARNPLLLVERHLWTMRHLLRLRAVGCLVIDHHSLLMNPPRASLFESCLLF